MGTYWDSSGNKHGFLATVVPEPSTLLLLGAGLFGLGVYARMRLRE